MGRSLHADTITAITSGLVRVHFAAKLAFASGTSRIWTGIGDKTINAETYTGVGLLGGIQLASETGDLRASSIVLTLSGVPSSSISLALSEHVVGRTATVYIVLLNASDGVIANPLSYVYRMNQLTISETENTATVGLRCDSILVDLQRSSERRYTDQDQRIDYPTDDGMEYVAGLQLKKVYWGPE